MGLVAFNLHSVHSAPIRHFAKTSNSQNPHHFTERAGSNGRLFHHCSWNRLFLPKKLSGFWILLQYTILELFQQIRMGNGRTGFSGHNNGYFEQMGNTNTQKVLEACPAPHLPALPHFSRSPLLSWIPKKPCNRNNGQLNHPLVSGVPKESPVEITRLS